MNDLPDNPNFLKILSIINATRAMYPHDSSTAKKKNNTNICGTKPNTAPTPATIPSKIKPFNQAAVPKDSNNPSIKLGIDGTASPNKLHPSPNTPSFAQSVAQVPTVVTEI